MRSTKVGDSQFTLKTHSFHGITKSWEIGFLLPLLLPLLLFGSIEVEQSYSEKCLGMLLRKKKLDSRRVVYPRPDPDTKYFNNLALSFFLARKGHVQGSLHKES